MTDSYVSIKDIVDISIHTPARGVTFANKTRYDGVAISIHTPARGVTNNNATNDYEPENFNPHSREGSDHYLK